MRAGFIQSFLKFQVQERTGFTLIEILLVIVLVSIFVGLVIPRIGILFFDYEFHSTVSRIEKVIQFASYDAVINKTLYRLSIDRHEKSFCLYQKKAHDDQKEFENVPGKVGSVLVLPENIELSHVTTDTIYFFPDGSSTNATFSLTHKNEKTVSFVMKGFVHGFKVVYQQ